MHAEVISDWFAKNTGGSLRLPNGWFGRPHDSDERLTLLTELEDNLVVVLSNRMRLTFTGLDGIEATPDELRLGPFRGLRVTYESDGELFAEYSSGVVRVVVHPMNRR